MPETTRKSCGKVCHYTEASAWCHTWQLILDGLDSNPSKLRPYRCQRCNAWHVGHGRRTEVALA